MVEVYGGLYGEGHCSRGIKTKAGEQLGEQVDGEIFKT